MKVKTVIRYYCDYCSKGMFKKPSMVRHEVSCTKNPKRGCGLCECSPETYDYTTIGTELVKRSDVVELEDTNGDRTDSFTIQKKDAIDWLYNRVDGCPACLLSVLQQSKVFAFDHFNYKDAVSEWHREQNPASLRIDC